MYHLKTAYFALLIIATASSCQKDFSVDPDNLSKGSLKNDITGNCLQANVIGTFKAGTLLTDSNGLQIQVDVTAAGSYTISTDSINGYYFTSSGAFTVTGINTILLKAKGTPVNSSSDNFRISYNNTECSISVPVLPGNSAPTAVFTLGAIGASCTGAVVQGTYTAGTALTAVNKVSIQVDVSIPGAYTISTTAINGITFSSSGIFVSAGTQTVILTASGTPATAGNTTVTVNAGNNNCSYTLNVLPASGNTAAAFTLGGAGSACTGADIQGTYTAGTALGSTNKVLIQVTVTTPGTYAINTTAIDGVTFSSSGTFSAAGSQTVTLTGNGTPETDGMIAVDVNAGGGTCNFLLTVLPAAAGDAAFLLASSGGNCSNSNVLGSYVLNTELNGTNSISMDVDVSVAGNWSVTTAATNGITFTGSGIFSATGEQIITLQGSGKPTTPGANVIEVTAGNSTCSFTVNVNDNSSAPCSPADNTADLSGVNSIAFYGVSGVASGGSYTITGNGIGGDVIMEFFGAFQPAAGVYTIQPYASDFSTGDVHVSFTASSIYWQTASGFVYVTVANQKVTAVICDVPFSGSLGGPAFHTNASAKITEE